ncbi:MAG: hypothetical protein ACRCWI_03715 [Brevinema sp.]
MKNLLLVMVFVTSATFANDICFLSPPDGQTIKKSLEIQIQPPYGNVPSVDVWIESDMNLTVLLGKLTAKKNYQTIVKVSKFLPGKYVIKAEYEINEQIFDGEVGIWIGDAQE